MQQVYWLRLHSASKSNKLNLENLQHTKRPAFMQVFFYDDIEFFEIFYL
jgi:uncharacterized pyridoxamine 5'-phosphate oxidase family protein